MKKGKFYWRPIKDRPKNTEQETKEETTPTPPQSDNSPLQAVGYIINYSLLIKVINSKGKEVVNEYDLGQHPNPNCEVSYAVVTKHTTIEKKKDKNILTLTDTRIIQEVENKTRIQILKRQK